MITEDNVDITKGDEVQTNLNWSSEITDIEKNKFSVPAMAPRKKKRNMKMKYVCPGHLSI